MSSDTGTLPPAPTAIEAAAEYQQNQQDDDDQGGVIHRVLPVLGWTQFTETQTNTARRPTAAWELVNAAKKESPALGTGLSKPVRRSGSGGGTDRRTMCP
jgi:hypothetical protein